MTEDRLKLSSISSVVVLLPGITGKAWQSGGLMIAQNMAHLLDKHIPTEVVTYVDREPEIPFLDDKLASYNSDTLFIATWGPHIQGLVTRLAGRNLAYYAQSTGWSITLPVTVPVISLSRYIMAHWMLAAPHNPLFLLGPVIPVSSQTTAGGRPIDVLFVKRKSTAYLQERLVPELRKKCEVFTVDTFISKSDLFDLYERSKVYLYSSAPWSSGWVEGFGLQPLEALACGCAVFSNLHGGLSDYLEPDEQRVFKLETYSLEYDIDRILRSVASGPPPPDSKLQTLIESYSFEAFNTRARNILCALDSFFSHARTHAPSIEAKKMSPSPRWRRVAYRARRQVKSWLQSRPKNAG